MPNAASLLIGRSEERRVLVGLIDGVAARGDCLVLRGEPGIGKTRLLADAEQRGRDRGMAVLSVAGVLSEADLPFGGLHQLLRPIRARAAGLPPVQRAALDAAFGLADGAAPERFQIAMATLDLITDLAAETPVLVLVDDAQWLDGATADVLAFVARRIASDPVVLLAGVRDGYGSALIDAGLTERTLGGLDAEEAAALLEAAAPELPLAARGEILRAAGGNPLALLELPAVPGPDGGGAVALTDRLERAFAGRARELPDAVQLILLVAALSDSDALAEILPAAAAVAGRALAAEDAASAAEASIVALDLQTLRFRHPLMRSAVVQSATLADRRRAHEELAVVLADQPDRRAWHRAALLSGEHPDVALELDAAAERARRQGAMAVAVSALRRAAELGAAGDRGGRLLAAAELAGELGRADLVEPLLREVHDHDLTEFERGRAIWVEETTLTRPLGDRTRFVALVHAATRALDAGERDLGIDLLWLVASRAGGPSPGLTRAVRW